METLLVIHCPALLIMGLPLALLKMWTRSSVGLERQTTDLKVTGSIPVESAIFEQNKGFHEASSEISTPIIPYLFRHYVYGLCGYPLCL